MRGQVPQDTKDTKTLKTLFLNPKGGAPRMCFAPAQEGQRVHARRGAGRSQKQRLSVFSVFSVLTTFFLLIYVQQGKHFSTLAKTLKTLAGGER